MSKKWHHWDLNLQPTDPECESAFGVFRFFLILMCNTLKVCLV